MIKITHVFEKYKDIKQNSLIAKDSTLHGLSAMNLDVHTWLAGWLAGRVHVSALITWC